MSRSQLFFPKKIPILLGESGAAPSEQIMILSARFPVFVKGDGVGGQDKAIECKQMRHHAIVKNRLNHWLKQEDIPADFKHHTNRRLSTEKTAVFSFAIKYIPIHKKNRRKMTADEPFRF